MKFDVKKISDVAVTTADKVAATLVYGAIALTAVVWIKCCVKLLKVAKQVKKEDLEKALKDAGKKSSKKKTSTTAN